MKLRIYIAILLTLCITKVSAQIGQHRNDLSIGINGGYIFSNVGFVPSIDQNQHGGMTLGFTTKYVCEKYFNTICSIYGEINYSSVGWKQDIKDIDGNPVINDQTNIAEEYSRTINYIQIPIFAHLAWGKEKKGMQFFFQLGPQFGFYISDKATYNYLLENRNMRMRANSNFVQEEMNIENKFDYGIAGGLGLEYSIPKAGSILFEARYYYGLGNIYGNSKRDYFSKSNLGNIVIKATYLFKLTG